MWCWRCKMELPMLDDDEYRIANELYSKGFSDRELLPNRAERFKPLLDYYEQVTGWKETEPNAIMHHYISLYGTPCEKCGKPYRTPKASFCASCGNKKS
jgi:hypothetical protein